MNQYSHGPLVREPIFPGMQANGFSLKTEDHLSGTPWLLAWFQLSGLREVVKRIMTLSVWTMAQEDGFSVRSASGADRFVDAAGARVSRTPRFLGV